MSNRKAFTLIELLVVIAVIAVLMAILMPSLRLARDQAKRIHCVSNVKTLSLAWYMYKDENDDKLVGGHTGFQYNFMHWVDVPPANDSPVEEKQDAVKRGSLFPYVKDVKIYHCPADTRKMTGSTAFRTFSLAGGANGETWSAYEKAVNYSDLKRPSSKLIFVEEMDNRGLNLGSWQMDPDRIHPSWTDPVAMWHNEKSTIGFADGHAEMHQWVDQGFIDWNLKAMYNNGFSWSGMTPGADEQTDIQYMAERFPYKKLK